MFNILNVCPYILIFFPKTTKYGPRLIFVSKLLNGSTASNFLQTIDVGFYKKSNKSIV